MQVKLIKFCLLLTILWFHSSESGSPCPAWETTNPCFCTVLTDGQTIVVCPGIQSTSGLGEAAKSMKSMIIDRLLLLNIFSNDNELDATENFIDPKTKVPQNGILPQKWLAELRVRELEIQNGRLNGCFMCNDALEGQSDFLTSLVVKNANLKGHICSSCSLGSPSTSISTRELKKTPRLKLIDLSYNNIEVVDGQAFPSTLTNLTQIILSNNQISRIHDGAFSLHQLKELDLSRNRITAITRKIFRNPDIMLKKIDLSYNSIQSLPEDMFSSLNGLKEVKLSHNLLEILPSNTWSKLPSLLEKIDLKDNFLICNCSMNWISRHLSKSTKILASCVGPKEVEFQELKPTISTLTKC